MKRVLITGTNSYIGKSVENWLMKEPEKYIVESCDMESLTWRETNFSDYDVIFHVAGIAHVSSNPRNAGQYYKVNRDLAISVAEKAKAEGVKQFVFMSSIIVYGDSSSNQRVIDIDTIPNPTDFYGKSKLMAEEGLKRLKTDQFKVVILRPPMIYGKGSKGNYHRLAKLARIIPIFPDFSNERSMLHVDNLCEFVKLIIDFEESGIFFPQNKEYVKTSGLVREIAEAHNKRIYLTKILNPIIKALFGINVIKKIFGNLTYDKSLSQYSKGTYQIRGFEESIVLTER
jgi:UDP-glucose 4-epimerase